VEYRTCVEVQSQGFSREVSGWGMEDVIPRVQLGWQRGDFAHTVYLGVITPTGFWEPGFSPIVSLHPPAIDTGWAFTWTDEPPHWFVAAASRPKIETFAVVISVGHRISVSPVAAATFWVPFTV
jgi:outer membrane putative beta-barrel porin/alpha-amylase